MLGAVRRYRAASRAPRRIRSVGGARNRRARARASPGFRSASSRRTRARRTWSRRENRGRRRPSPRRDRPSAARARTCRAPAAAPSSARPCGVQRAFTRGRDAVLPPRGSSPARRSKKSREAPRAVEQRGASGSGAIGRADFVRVRRRRHPSRRGHPRRPAAPSRAPPPPRAASAARSARREHARAARRVDGGSIATTTVRLLFPVSFSSATVRRHSLGITTAARARAASPRSNGAGAPFFETASSVSARRSLPRRTRSTRLASSMRSVLNRRRRGRRPPNRSPRAVGRPKRQLKAARRERRASASFGFDETQHLVRRSCATSAASAAERAPSPGASGSTAQEDRQARGGERSAAAIWDGSERALAPPPSASAAAESGGAMGARGINEGVGGGDPSRRPGRRRARRARALELDGAQASARGRRAPDTPTACVAAEV